MDFDVADLGLADKGDLRIEWAFRSMPVLSEVQNRFEVEKPLQGLNVGACLHVTAETANLMETLRMGGARVFLCASNPLSTQDDVAAALVREGLGVYAIRGADRELYYKHITAVLGCSPDITMDDGADLVTTIIESWKDFTPIGSTEETTTGVLRLRAMEKAGVLRFPVVAVNDSATKHLFDNVHGTGQSSLDGLMRATNQLFAGKTVVVIGYGDCGRGVSARVKGLGAQVIVVEVDPVRALAAAMEGYRVMRGIDAAVYGDIFVTVTGDINVLRGEHFVVMKDGAILANAGHFDVEIALNDLAYMTKGPRKIRDNLDEWVFPHGKCIYVVAEGRLVNLAAAEGHPADVMDMSFANQALAAEWLVKNKGSLEPKVYILPKEIDDQVARLKLDAMGAGLDVLTDDQIKYLQSWKEGT